MGETDTTVIIEKAKAVGRTMIEIGERQVLDQVNEFVDRAAAVHGFGTAFSTATEPDDSRGTADSLRRFVKGDKIPVVKFQLAKGMTFLCPVVLVQQQGETAVRAVISPDGLLYKVGFRDGTDDVVAISRKSLPHGGRTQPLLSVPDGDDLIIGATFMFAGGDSFITDQKTLNLADIVAGLQSGNKESEILGKAQDGKNKLVATSHMFGDTLRAAEPFVW